MQITSKQGQWLGDISVREAGNIDSVVAMAIDNNLSAIEKMVPGTPIQRPESADRRVMNYYGINDIYPATSADPDHLSGIGYMAVEITFMVS